MSATADLSIVKTASASSVSAGAPYSYTLNVSNGGPITASTVSVSDTLPAGVSYVSASGTGWTCNQAAGTVTCSLATLPVGAANPITINVTAPLVTGTPSNTATVTAATPDLNPGNNSSSASVTVTALADLSVVKNSLAATAYSGTPFSYNIQVTNNGPGQAVNVSVSDTLPTGSTFVSAGGSGWSCTHTTTTATCTAATLAVGTASPITLTVNAPAYTPVPPNPITTPSPTPFTNTVTVSSDTGDPVSANNSSTYTVPLLASSAIPTMNEWTLLLLGAFLSIAGVVALRRNF